MGVGRAAEEAMLDGQYNLAPYRNGGGEQPIQRLADASLEHVLAGVQRGWDKIVIRITHVGRRGLAPISQIKGARIPGQWNFGLGVKC